MAPAPLRVAEINPLPGVHPFLSKLPWIISTEYGTDRSEDLMALSYPDQSFDIILTSDTLEHVPDFDVALREIHRVLRPGGKHIFTVPVIWDRCTRQRAVLEKGSVVHLLPPSYHGTPGLDVDDYLVFNEFGGDVVGRIEKAGFSVEVREFEGNPMASVLIATASGKPTQ
jgi:SAM-dependent methyltransferase